MDTAKVNFIENMAFTGSVDGFQIALDATPEHGGAGLGTRPKPLILVALAGCTGMDVASLVKKMRVEIDSFDIDAQADTSQDTPVVYTHIRLLYNFTGREGIADKLHKIVEMSQERYCGVAAMLRQVAQLSYTITLNGKEV